MFKRSLLAAALITSVALPYGSAQAATAGPVSFTVTATVANFCTLSAQNVAFGTVNAGAAATNTSNNVSLTCNKGVNLTSLALNDGANGSSGQKRMINGTEFLNYNIDRPTGGTFNTCPAAAAGPEWNATNTVSSATLFSTGGLKTIPICASIPANQFPSAGSYSDTVQVTATYN